MNFNFSTSGNNQTKQMKPWQGVLFGLLFVIVGIVVLFFAVSTIKTYNEKNKTFVETTSQVVDYKYDDEGLQAIIVEYVVDGQTYRKVSNTYSNMPKSIGTEVSIKYNPNNPNDAIWTSDSTNIILPILGAVFTLVGVILVISSIKNGKKPKMIEEQPMNNIEQPQMNNITQQINNVEQPQMNNITQQINNVEQPQMNNIAQPINNVEQPQMNNFNQTSSNVDINNQNNNINTNM